MAASSTEIAVFADTNLGTQFAVGVSSDITAAELKRELERVHCSCFPNLGDISVEAFMVKKNVHFYHLPANSAPILHFFQEDSDKSWLYLSLNITLLNFAETKRKSKRNGCVQKKMTKSKKRMFQFSRVILFGSRLTAHLLKKGKSKRCAAKVKDEQQGGNRVLRQKLSKTVTVSCELNTNREGKNHHLEELDLVTDKNLNSQVGMVENGSGGGSCLSGVAPSVSELIKRYFSSIIEEPDQSDGEGLSRLEVSSSKRPKILGMPCNEDQTPPILVKCKADTARGSGGIERSEVGKRLVQALEEQEDAQSRQKSMTSLCKSSDRRRLSDPPGSSCPVKSLVFEIGGDSD